MVKVKSIKKNKLLNNDYTLSFISKLFVILFGFLSVIFLNRYLGASLKGEYSTIINIVTIMASILHLGIPTIYPYFKRKRIQDCYGIFTTLSIIEFGILILATLLVIIITRDVKISTICTTTSIAVFTTQLRYINLVENIKYNAFVVTTIEPFNFIMTLFAFILLPRYLVIAIIIYILKDLIIVALYTPKIIRAKVFKKSHYRYFPEIIKKGILPMLSGLLIILNYKIDIIMLNGYSIDFKMIGIYSVGLSISEYLWVIPDIFKDVVQKRTAKDNSIQTVNFSLRCSTTFIMLAFIILLIMGSNLFSIIFGEEYRDSYNITMMLFFGVFSMIFYKIIGQLFIADGKSKQYFLTLLIGVIANIIINAIVIPKYSIYGATLASVVSYTLIGALFTLMYLRYYNVKLVEVLFIKNDDIKKINSLLFTNNKVISKKHK